MNVSLISRGEDVFHPRFTLPDAEVGYAGGTGKGTDDTDGKTGERSHRKRRSKDKDRRRRSRTASATQETYYNEMMREADNSSQDTTMDRRAGYDFESLRNFANKFPDVENPIPVEHSPETHRRTLPVAGNLTSSMPVSTSAIDLIILRELSESIRSLDKTMQSHGEKKNRVFWNGKRPEKVIVYIRIVFLKLGEIDTIKENFDAEAFVQATWREPRLDKITDQEFEKFQPDQYWNPRLQVENGVGDIKETLWFSLVRNSKGGAFIQEKRRVKGKFLEFMELKKFPFDSQDLTISMTTERLETEVSLAADTTEVSGINLQSFVDEQEWSLHNHTTIQARVAKPQFKNARGGRSIFSASCVASRRPGFFMYNILLVMLFICSLSFCTFAVDPQLTQNRLQLAFTLVLTTVAFKFVVNQSLPKISYLTYLDKYVLGSMCILITICVWHAILPSCYDFDTVSTNTNTTSASAGSGDDLNDAEKADRVALLVLGGVYIIFHIIFFCAVFLTSFLNKRSFRRKETAENLGYIGPDYVVEREMEEFQNE